MSDVEPPTATPFPLPDPPPRHRPRVKKLRLLFVLAFLTVLAVVSTVFGMMMAVASDLPSLESLPQAASAKNSVLYDARNRRLGLLTSNQNRVIVPYEDISVAMRHAIIAIEDERFYTNSGVDLRGIGRAFYQDVVKKKAVQGGSTIAQQFIKIALQAQDKRTVFQKLRESALAYHLTRKWSKEKILTEYLNTIYFGNGAYGIESAARTYFGDDHPGCGKAGGKPCASLLTPDEAATIAGIVANPTAFDPLYHPDASVRRRNIVLAKMLEQGYVTRSEYDEDVHEPPANVNPPFDDSKAPYFTTWVRQQLVDRYGAHEAFEGGLNVRTTLDLDYQDAAQKAVKDYLSDPNGPTAALVAIDNKTGAVRAMVGGSATNGKDFAKAPFNLATQGQRQPGSSFKPFVLAAALRKGIAPGSTWPSQKRTFYFKNAVGNKEAFEVNNYEGNYVGVSTLANATINSDNSVYAAVGFRTGFKNISQMATKMGIRTPVSTNPAITLGGLKQGVTVLDMAHAYETFAEDGQRTYGSLGAREAGPVGIRMVKKPDGTTKDGEQKYKVLSENKVRKRQAVSSKLAETAVPILQGVVKFGTGKAAQIQGQVIAGKTGTTENYGDAWFVAFTDRITVAVWVGYPNETKPMEHEFRGEPVSGGTYPALIWRDFVTATLKINEDRANEELARINEKRAAKGQPPLTREGTTVPDTTTLPAGTTTVPATTVSGSTTTTTTPQDNELPAQTTQQQTNTPPTTPTPPPTPTPTPTPTPGQTTPAQTTPADSGGGTGGAGASP